MAGARAKTYFDNLKKNYPKKRINQLSFMVWLDDFTRPRTSLSSLDDSQLSDNG